MFIVCINTFLLDNTPAPLHACLHSVQYLQFFVCGGASSRRISAKRAALSDKPRIPSPHSFSALKSTHGRWQIPQQIRKGKKNNEKREHLCGLTLCIQCIYRCSLRWPWPQSHSTKRRWTWVQDTSSFPRKKESWQEKRKESSLEDRLATSVNPITSSQCDFVSLWESRLVSTGLFGLPRQWGKNKSNLNAKKKHLSKNNCNHISLGFYFYVFEWNCQDFWQK